MRDVPINFRLTPTQQRVVDVAKSGRVYRSPELVKILELLVDPASYLDFETFTPAIPIYLNTRAYQRIPFQWSLHRDNGSGSLVHADFLAKGDTDPRREFSERLLKAAEQFPGVVMVWSHFEASVIRDMSELFPDLAEKLTALLDRTVDLLRIVRDHVAHPEFLGSFSMKAVAPAVAPEVTYGDLDIADGGEASAAFYRVVADPTLSPEARDVLRQSLLKYCQRDTLALARVHQWLMVGANTTDAATITPLPVAADMDPDKMQGRPNRNPLLIWRTFLLCEQAGIDRQKMTNLKPLSRIALSSRMSKTG
jgi:hypothetical protein